MNSNIAIKIENVSKTFRIPHEKVDSIRGAAVNLFKNGGYEEFKALDDVSFEVKKGEFFGIIGRNGSGKSTLLKILAGIYAPDKIYPVKSGEAGAKHLTGGKVQIDGMISPFLELGIGFNPELSGRDNVYLNATVLGMTKKQIDEKFDSIVTFSELERFIDQKLKNYSSGMQVRLAFSVSIHANREILLMDEVLAVGDSNFQSKCLEEFNKYKNAGKTVVLVTHDIGTVQRYCDRAMLLRNGKIVKIGKAEEVGNAYVYENMSDEERRIGEEEMRKISQAEKKLKNMKGKELEAEKKRIEEEKKKQEEMRKNKIAEITGVEFLDKDRNKKNVFETGYDMSIRVCFKQYKNVPVLNFGLAIFNQEENYIFGINTFIDKINTKKCIEDGFFEVTYKKIPLRNNTYYIKAGIWQERSDKLVDSLGRSNSFRIFSNDKKDGMINLDYVWKQ